MKRLRSSDSLGALITICPTSEEQLQNSPRNGHVYGREFRAMLDDEGFAELEEDQQMMSCHVSEKKRRLSVDQVKALEKNFEVENKLEPERKVKLAQELGLQPRQVAVWFQNRRARWKTKQLERDYGHLKANYDSLKLNFETLKRDHEALQQQIKELKAKVKEEKPEATVLPAELGLNAFEATNDVVFVDHFRDGSSDSDSSAVVNDDKNGVVATGKVVAAANDMSSESSGMVKIEEHDFFGGEETTCDFFSDQQAPTMPWYCSGEDQWN